MPLQLANTVLQLAVAGKFASATGKYGTCGSAAGKQTLRLGNILLRLKNAILRLAAIGKYGSAAGNVLL